jgi:hypothetical protein
MSSDLPEDFFRRLFLFLIALLLLGGLSFLTVRLFHALNTPTSSSQTQP